MYVMKMYKYIGAFFGCLSMVGYSQVGIGTLTPEATFDVNKEIKLSGIQTVSNNNEEYNQVLLSNEEGDLGFAKVLAKNAYIYRNSYFKKMTAFVWIGANEQMSLNLPLTIVVPANRVSLVEIAYNIPITGDRQGAAVIQLQKKTGNGIMTVIKEATRKIVFSRNYNNGPSALGQAVSNSYFDRIENNSSEDLTVTYDVYGLAFGVSRIVRFGMFANVPLTNYNWGRGALFITVYDL